MKYRHLWSWGGVLVTWCPRSEWSYKGSWWGEVDKRYFRVMGLEVSY